MLRKKKGARGRTLTVGDTWDAGFGDQFGRRTPVWSRHTCFRREEDLATVSCHIYIHRTSIHTHTHIHKYAYTNNRAHRLKRGARQEWCHSQYLPLTYARLRTGQTLDFRGPTGLAGIVHLRPGVLCRRRSTRRRLLLHWRDRVETAAGFLLFYILNTFDYMSVKSRLKNEAQALRESGVSLKGWTRQMMPSCWLCIQTFFSFFFFVRVILPSRMSKRLSTSTYEAE